MILYMGIVLYAPSLALESTVGIDKRFAIIIIGITVILYCFLGGIKAVLISDVFQSILMFVAVFLVIISGIVYANGIENIFIAADKGGRLELWNFDPDPTVRHSWFTLVIGGMFTYLTLYAVNQTQVQRLMTVKSLKGAQQALWWSWPILTLLSLTTSFSGLVIFNYYKTCDPLRSGRISKPDQIMPIYVVDALGHMPGVCGLFVAGIFSATLSTLSSCLNSLAAVTLEDYIKPIFKLVTGKKLELPESHSAVPSKIIAAAYGVVCIGMAFVAQNFGSILEISLSIFGAVGGPLLALFTLGMTTMSANEYGSTTGLFSGVIFSLFIGFADKPRAPVSKIKATTVVKHTFQTIYLFSDTCYLSR
jgi:sodium-coupled monocarboxylate transporter 8/12